MDESRIHGLHRIGEVLEALYPELITQINHKRMEYFKVIVHNSTSTMEVNRDESGDFIFTIMGKHGMNPMRVYLSKTEAKDLSGFILKRLSEKQPDEVNQPF